MTTEFAPAAGLPDGLADADGLPDDLPDDLAAAALALARRLHAGATLWCASPQWPHHAQHVAVEFVHPVIVGKPALPAVALPAEGLPQVLRANSVPGDVALLIGPADDAVLADVVRRSPAWGVRTLWVGAGERPAHGAADHVLWLPDQQAAHDGGFILLYHLLWELAHVCLEHRGVLPAPDDGPTCAVCSDDGVLAEVQAAAENSARVRTSEGEQEVDLSLVGPVEAHDLLVVHAGMAITRLATTAVEAP